MRVYSDTSSLIKLVVDEDGSAEVREFLPRLWPIAALEFTPVEIASGLRRTLHRGTISIRDAQLADSQLGEIWADMLQLPLTTPIVQDARTIVFQHDLCTVDSLHLAAALQLSRDIDDEVVLATFDRRLANAASSAGLDTWPREFPKE